MIFPNNPSALSQMILSQLNKKLVLFKTEEALSLASVYPN